MNGSESRQEFRVVLDGVELDEGQRDKIALAVQKAALEALSESAARLESPVLLGHTGIKYRPEWRGIWILDRSIADELAPQIERLGFLPG